MCMSFYDGTLNKEKAIKLVRETSKPTYTRYGFAYKGAEKRKASKETLIHIIETDSMIDVYDNDDCVIVNQYSTNDMW